ncbi:ABC transporter ATP-binding protein [Pseudochelatococcus sp. B33]
MLDTAADTVNTRAPARPGNNPASLELVGLNKRFGNRWAARDFNLVLPAGKLLVLLGPSGSGKTTTLNMIAGFISPDRGSILLDGSDVTPIPTHRRNFGMVFQASTLFPHLTVAENICYGLKLRKVPSEMQKRKLAEMLTLIDLPGREDAYPAQLSGGEQQRVGLARALTLEPRLLLLDEPLSSLDAKLRRQIREEIRSIQLRHGITTVMVTHDQEEALAVGDVVAVIDQGALQQADTPENVYRDPANAFVAGFVGENNLLPGVIAAVEPHTVKVTVDGGYVVTAARPSSHAGQGDKVLVVVRPENMTTRSLNGANAATGKPGENVVTGTVRVAQFLGTRKRCVVNLDGGGPNLNVDAPPYADIHPGSKAEISWRGDDSRVVTR